VKKTFDAAAWMRKRRIEIDEEDRDLSWEEKRKKTRKLLDKDPLWLRLKNRLIVPTEFSDRSAQTDQEEYPERHPH
jgi:hypothetical protein